MFYVLDEEQALFKGYRRTAYVWLVHPKIQDFYFVSRARPNNT
jgi:hypothetical protein